MPGCTLSWQMSERKHSVKKVTALHWAHTAGHRQSTQKAPPAPRNCLSCKQSDQSFAASTAVTSVSSSGTTCLRSVLCPLPTLGCPSVTPAPKFHLPRAGPQPWPEDAFCIPQPADHTRGTGVSNTGFKMECAAHGHLQGRRRRRDFLLSIENGLCGYGRKKRGKNVKTFTEPADYRNNRKENHSLLGSQ